MDSFLNLIPVTWLSHTQAKILTNKYYLFRSDNFLGKTLLTILMYLETYLYNGDRLYFGETRREKLGNTFCALGRVMTVGYNNTLSLIDKPSQREGYIGRVKFDPNRFPQHFTLFSSNIGKSGKPHSIYHNLLVKYLIGGGISDRLEDDKSNLILKRFISNFKKTIPRSSLGKEGLRINGSCQVDFEIEMVELFLIEWLFYLFLDIFLESRDLMKLFELLSISKGGGTTSKYLLSRLTNKIDKELENWIIEKIMKSSILTNYLVPDENHQFDVRQMSELILAIISIAGFLGVLNTLLASLSIDIHGEGIHFPKIPSSKEGLDNYILEVIRRFGPVNLVNIVLENPINIIIGGKEYTFPEATVVGYSLLNIGFDLEGPFTDPFAFNPKREGLGEKMLNFNGVGMGSEENLLNNRRCPGRFMALRMIKKVLLSITNKD